MINGLVINPFTEANLELRKKRMTNPNSDATRNFGNTIQPKRAEKPVVNQGEALVIYNNQKFVINKSPFVIGRENADITIPETYISNRANHILAFILRISKTLTSSIIINCTIILNSFI